MEAKTPKEFFEQILPRRFKPDKAAGVDVTIQVNIVGTNGGDWTVTIRNLKLEVKEGMHSSPKLLVKMKETDCLDIVNGKMSGQNAFFSGKLQLKGDIMLALRLKEIGFL